MKDNKNHIKLEKNWIFIKHKTDVVNVTPLKFNLIKNLSGRN